MDRSGDPRIDRWVRIGDNMPKRIGDIGFPIAVHPRDPDTVWVFPMDGTAVWPRVSPGGKPASYVTHDAGKTWTRQSQGFPKSQAWWTVKRQAMAIDTHEPVGLYLGTTSGEVWASRSGGKSWACIARHLQEIYSVEVAMASRCMCSFRLPSVPIRGTEGRSSLRVPPSPRFWRSSIGSIPDCASAFFPNRTRFVSTSKSM